MKCLKRNMTEFEYLPNTHEESDLNSDGEHTGDFYPVYGTPIRYEGNISTPSGNTNQTFYGEDIRYTHTLVMDNPDIGIDEYGMIRWKGHSYAIMAIRPSLNSVTIALKRQTDETDNPYVSPEPGTAEPEEPDESQDEGDG